MFDVSKQIHLYEVYSEDVTMYVVITGVMENIQFFEEVIHHNKIYIEYVLKDKIKFNLIFRSQLFALYTCLYT